MVKESFGVEAAGSKKSRKAEKKVGRRRERRVDSECSGFFLALSEWTEETCRRVFLRDPLVLSCLVLSGPYMIIYGAYMIIYGPYMIIYGPYMIIYGPYMIIHGPYMIIYGPYMIVYGPYMIIYCVYDLTYGPYIIVVHTYAPYMITYRPYMPHKTESKAPRSRKNGGFF